MNLYLNDNQKIATLHNTGPMMVLSGPGSGKTTVITHRVKNLIEKFNVKPCDILVITFTKSASIEMKNRFLSLNLDNNDVTFATFHSYFFRIIKSYYKYNLDNVLKDFEKTNFFKHIFKTMEINFDNQDEFSQNIFNISNEISIIKNTLIPFYLFESKVIDFETFVEIYKLYEDFKIENNKIDFDDMLIKCYNLLTEDESVRTFWQNKYKYILIDEFQDINKVQYECIKILSKHQNIFIVGDDDQSIYGFRGSNPNFLVKFSEDFSDAKKIILNINYRSSDEIINLCNNIISDNVNRYPKDIVGIQRSGKIPVLLESYDTYEEAKKIVSKIKALEKHYTLNQIAIIYRTNLQASMIVNSLMAYDILYQVKDTISSIYNHFVSKDIIAYLKLAIYDISNNSIIQIINKPKRYINNIYINNAIKECGDENCILSYLYSYSSLKSYQLEHISDLIFNINILKSKSSYDAIKYILNHIGYLDYIDEYCEFKSINKSGFLEIINEVLESSKLYPKIQDFLIHIDDFNKKLKEQFNKDDCKNGVTLTTMHSAKGLEFDVVFVTGCSDGIIPHEKAKSSVEIEEERRLFYVALTRAKHRLFISILKTRYEKTIKHSRFLNKLI